MIEFIAFQKIPRLHREIVITEKIDGTNACVVIEQGQPGDPQEGYIKGIQDGTFFFKIGAQSRSQAITLENDNHGFARWVYDNAENLLALGPGHHYGEWWGAGIQRRYGLNEKRFSLFNVHRWGETRPSCCHVVPILWRGLFNTGEIYDALEMLRLKGSQAAPGFMKPEGIIIFHTAANALFKVTIEKDDEWKGKQ